MCNSYNRQNLSPLERKLVCVALAKKQLKKTNKENSKKIKYTLRSKSGNPEGLKK